MVRWWCVNVVVSLHCEIIDIWLVVHCVNAVVVTQCLVNLGCINAQRLINSTVIHLDEGISLPDPNILGREGIDGVVNPRLVAHCEICANVDHISKSTHIVIVNKFCSWYQFCVGHIRIFAFRVRVGEQSKHTVAFDQFIAIVHGIELPCSPVPWHNGRVLCGKCMKNKVHLSKCWRDHLKKTVLLSVANGWYQRGYSGLMDGSTMVSSSGGE